MRNDEKLLAWAESKHWTILVLSERDKTFIPAGEQNWRAWVARADQQARRQAWQRIEQWNQREEPKSA
jgi:hypothetical protein